MSKERQHDGVYLVGDETAPRNETFVKDEGSKEELVRKMKLLRPDGSEITSPGDSPPRAPRNLVNEALKKADEEGAVEAALPGEEAPKPWQANRGEDIPAPRAKTPPPPPEPEPPLIPVTLVSDSDLGTMEISVEAREVLLSENKAILIIGYEKKPGNAIFTPKQVSSGSFITFDVTIQKENEIVALENLVFLGRVKFDNADLQYHVYFSGKIFYNIMQRIIQEEG
jgi:hypothetical protein